MGLTDTTTVHFRPDWMDTCTRCPRYLSLFLNSATWSNVFPNIVNLNIFFIFSDIVSACYRVSGNILLYPIVSLCSNLLLYIYLSLPLPSLTQVSDMSENEDMLLEFFVSLPQLKQVTSDKEELVTNIVDMASKFLFCSSTKALDGQSWKRSVRWDEFYKGVCVSVCHLQRETFRWSPSSKENNKKCSIRSDITSSLLLCSFSNRPTLQTHTCDCLAACEACFCPLTVRPADSDEAGLWNKNAETAWSQWGKRPVLLNS